MMYDLKFDKAMQTITFSTQMRLASSFKLTPDKILSFKNEKCSGWKLSKERITVIVCGNMIEIEITAS